MTTASSSTLDALYSSNMPAITSIYSASSNNNFTLPSQSTSATTSVATRTPPPMSNVRPVSALIASSNFNNVGPNGPSPSLGVGLRPRNDRNSSMRSVVSGEFFFFSNYKILKMI